MSFSKFYLLGAFPLNSTNPQISWILLTYFKTSMGQIWKLSSPYKLLYIPETPTPHTQTPSLISLFSPKRAFPNLNSSKISHTTKIFISRMAFHVACPITWYYKLPPHSFIFLFFEHNFVYFSLFLFLSLILSTLSLLLSKNTIWVSLFYVF